MIGAKPPTAAELEFMGRCKAGPCVPCLVGVSLGIILPAHACRGGDAVDGHELPMMQFHHAKVGNLRQGHRHGYAACLWHHNGRQQLHALGIGYGEALARWGWNLHDHARQYHDTFGSEADLIEVQQFILERDGLLL